MLILSFTNCPLDPKLGSGKTVLNYSQGLKSLGHSADVAEPNHYEPWQNIRKAKKFRQAWGAYNLAKQKLQVKQYDVIEFYGDEFWLATQQLSKLPKRPLLVAHTNGLELLDYIRRGAYQPHSNLLQSWFFQQTHVRFSNIAFAHADAFVSLCELDRQHVLNLGLYPANRTAVVEPGLDQEYLSLPFVATKEERIAFMGSWISRKGVNNVIAVITKILTQYPKLHFDIYGASSAQEKILADFPIKLHNRITVHPRLSNQDIADSLAKAKVFFFPSQYEGFGIALAEAMACSCAVVTTPTGFGAELQNEQEALLCNFDDTEAMEHAIMRLLQDYNLQTKIAYQGWTRVRSLSWESNIQKLAAIYREWIAEHQASKA